MILFRKLRTSLHHQFLKRKLRKANHPRKITNYERAKTVGVLFDAAHPDNVRIARKFSQQLTDMNKFVHVFAYLHTAKPTESIPFPYMTKKNLNWLFIPKHPQVDEFLNKHFDLLINLCMEDCLPLEYVAALSNASYRAGRFIEGKEYCAELMINLHESRDMNYLIEQLNVYLKMIK